MHAVLKFLLIIPFFFVAILAHNSWNYEADQISNMQTHQNSGKLLCCDAFLLTRLQDSRTRATTEHNGNQEDEVAS